MKTITSLMLAALPLAGCAHVFGGGASATQRLKLGEIGDFGPVDMTPIAIDEDSRCPADAQCVSAGTVRVKVLVEPPGESHAYFVTLGQPLAIDEGTLLIEAVQPQRMSAAPIPLTDYSVVLNFAPSGA